MRNPTTAGLAPAASIRQLDRASWGVAPGAGGVEKSCPKQTFSTPLSSLQGLLMAEAEPSSIRKSCVAIT